MNKIEHIGIAVKDLEAANQIYAALLGVAHYKTETVESEGVNTSFFKSGPNKIELLEGTNPESPITQSLSNPMPDRNNFYKHIYIYIYIMC